MLLAWYSHHARTMPWRVAPKDSLAGVFPDPYHVWLSEVMLQQTQVSTVEAYWRRFVVQWPTVHDLAAAPQAEIMQAWAGLGYYSRARNLGKCAELVSRERDGAFPQTAVELIKLPGIGAYTSAAIAAIAFGEPVAVVDGNVERVMSRLRAIATPLPELKKVVGEVLQPLVPASRPGDFAQALMDLGATICMPKNPACKRCPLESLCVAGRNNEAELYPMRPARQAKPLRRGAAYVLLDEHKRVLLVRRPDKGLLGGMSGVPTTSWTVRADGATGTIEAPVNTTWRMAGEISHEFTHFRLALEVWVARDLPAKTGVSPTNAECWWAEAASLQGEALPTVMKKVIAAAIPQAFKPIRQTNHGIKKA